MNSLLLLSSRIAQFSVLVPSLPGKICMDLTLQNLEGWSFLLQMVILHSLYLAFHCNWHFIKVIIFHPLVLHNWFPVCLLMCFFHSPLCSYCGAQTWWRWFCFFMFKLHFSKLSFSQVFHGHVVDMNHPSAPLQTSWFPHLYGITYLLHN